MSKRVVFKNVSKDPTKRVRTTHGDGVLVDVGNQTGAVYYGDSELGMCLSEPEVIDVTNAPETQCMSLVGLYDMFIDGKRVGRAMTQEEIAQRVNAGDYGLEAEPCVNVSCENAVGVTACLELPGLWDVEINDILVARDVDQDRILKILKDNPQIRATECVESCVASGEYVLAAKDILGSGTYPAGTSVVFACKFTPTNQPDIVQYVPVILKFDEYNIYSIPLDPNQESQPVAWRGDSATPWDKAHLLSAIQSAIPTMGAQMTPWDYLERRDSQYCLDGKQNFGVNVRVTNSTALVMGDYYYTGGYRLSFGSMLPEAYMRVVFADGSGSHTFKYSYSVNGRSKEAIELELLEFFKASFEGVGMTGTITPSEFTETPPAYNGGPATSHYILELTAQRRFTAYYTQQWQGTAAHPELYNTRMGWPEKAIGLTVGGGYHSSSNSFTEGWGKGCSIRPMTPEEVDLRVIVQGVSDPIEGQPQEQPGVFIPNQMTMEFVDFAEVGMTPPANSIHLLDILPSLKDAAPVTTCGLYYFVQAPE